MMKLLTSSFLPFLLLLSLASAANIKRKPAWPTCKITPSSPLWPSHSEWAALNASVSGRLIAPEPLGGVCHQNRPEYNQAACAKVSAAWTSEAIHRMDPTSVMYNDNTCLPNNSAPCIPGGYPAYVIAATSVQDIQAGVKFAAKTGVRLIVKGTGHDYPARSSGPGALSIWTYNMRDVTIDLSKGDPSVGSSGTAKIMAGADRADVFNAAAAVKSLVVTGADPGVGIGGLLTGGGHGPVTSRYGLACDNILSMEVVTADGKLVTADPHTNQDLFWAMLGGGGSTFGVLVSATARVFPDVPFTYYYWRYNATAGSDTYWDLVQLFHEYLPQMSDDGAMGYYYLYTQATPTTGFLEGNWLLPELTEADGAKIFAPLNAAIKARQPHWKDRVTSSAYGVPYDSYTNGWANLTGAGEGVGFSGRLGSRLFDRAALSNPNLGSALRTATPPSSNLILGHLVAGKAVHNAKIPGGSNSVLPAWRSTYAHIVLQTYWTPTVDMVEADEIQADLRNVRTPAIVAVAPNTGAYINEADPSTVNWQQTFWGENYGRLKRLKDKYDPKGVFWCHPCVGSEEWTVVGGDAIGQDPGTICRI